MNICTEYSQDEYGFTCKHAYEFIHEYIMTISKMSALHYGSFPIYTDSL